MRDCLNVLRQLPWARSDLSATAQPVEGGSLERNRWLGLLAGVGSMWLLIACQASPHVSQASHAAVLDPEPSASPAVSVYNPPQPAGPLVLLTDVAVDEDFIERVGPDWENEVTRILVHANEILGQVGLMLQPSRTIRWDSDDSEVSMKRLLDAVDSSDPVSGRLLLAITCQDTVVFDGWADGSGRRAIVQYYHDSSWRTSTLISHELGHLLGIQHHDEDEECDSDGCIMDDKGYAHADTWCDHHKEQIESLLANTAI